MASVSSLWRAVPRCTAAAVPALRRRVVVCEYALVGTSVSRHASSHRGPSSSRAGAAGGSACPRHAAAQHATAVYPHQRTLPAKRYLHASVSATTGAIGREWRRRSHWARAVRAGFAPGRASASTTASGEATKAADADDFADADTEEAFDAFAFEDPRDAVLAAALRAVPLHGWSTAAIAAGANEVGFPSVSHGMFPGGAMDLVAHFMNSANSLMTSRLTSLPLADMTADERVKAGVRLRLEQLGAHIDTWPQAMAVGLHPNNVTTTATLLLNTVDDIWYLSGDRSSDMSWYSRRVLLLCIYASTEAYMLTDRSANFEDTWAFLDRAVEHTSDFGRSVGEFGSLQSAVSIGATSLASAATALALPLLRSAMPNVASAEAAWHVIQSVLAYVPSGAPRPPSARRDTATGAGSGHDDGFGDTGASASGSAGDSSSGAAGGGKPGASA